MRIKLTPDFIATRLVVPPGRKRIEYVDRSSAVGLYVEVRATSPGQGTFYLRYKDATGKTCHQRIGRTTEMDLDEARDRAKKLRAQITLGTDPKAATVASKSVLTFDAFFRAHYLPYVKMHKRTWKKDLQMYELRVQRRFGFQRLNRISRQQIQTFHASLLRDEGLSPATSDHFLKLIRQVINKAVAWEFVDLINPASRIPLFNPDNRVQNNLRDEELARLLRALETDSDRNVAPIFLWLLSTGQRLGEALSAEWRLIDRRAKTWTIPAATSKGKRTRSVPLNSAALAVLDELDTEGRYDYLFINPRTGLPYRNPYKAWRRICKKAELRLRIHDLRHIHASLLANAGESAWVISQLLGHRQISTVQRYMHADASAMLNASNKAADLIQIAMKKSA